MQTPMDMQRYKWIILALSLLCLLFVILIGSQQVPWLLLNNFQLIKADSRATDQGRPEQTTVDNKTRTILVWYWPWGMELDPDVCKIKSSVSNCIMTSNRSRFPDADLVLFHNWELVRENPRLPTDLRRPEEQRWVWFSQEPPMYNGNLKPFAGIFNWTMSYHRQADIYLPYGLMVAKETVSNEPVENFIPKNKTHLACWVVGNLKPELERSILYEKLKNVIPIERYGKTIPNRKLSDEDMHNLISHCYFYLAFENSVSKDYITEKFWHNAYNGGAVPVVLGPPREQYEAVAPKDSFIHVNDFKSAEELGEFLKELAKDKTRYASYFNWRSKYHSTTTSWADIACKFCSKMSSMGPLPHKVYEDLDAFQR